jgi:hypothetical protein
MATRRAVRRQPGDFLMQIMNAADLKYYLRLGAFTNLGGYPLYFVCADGEALSYDTVRANFREVLGAIGDRRNGWCVVANAINWEDTELCDAHTGARIPAAYGAEG